MYNLSALSYAYRYENKKIGQQIPASFSGDVYLRVLIRVPKSCDEDLESNFVEIDEVHHNRAGTQILGTLRAQSLKHLLCREEISCVLMESLEHSPGHKANDIFRGNSLYSY